MGPKGQKPLYPGGVGEQTEIEIKWIHIIIISHHLGIEERVWATNCKTK